MPCQSFGGTGLGGPQKQHPHPPSGPLFLSPNINHFAQSCFPQVSTSCPPIAPENGNQSVAVGHGPNTSKAGHRLSWQAGPRKETVVCRGVGWGGGLDGDRRHSAVVQGNAQPPVSCLKGLHIPALRTGVTRATIYLTGWGPRQTRAITLDLPSSLE